MNSSKKIVIINNERVSERDNNFFCENIDMKSIPEGLDKNFDVTIIIRKSKNAESHQICINKIATKNCLKLPLKYLLEFYYNILFI